MIHSIFNIAIFRFRPDIEAIWDSIVGGRKLVDPSTILPVNFETFTSSDAVITLDQFVQFWSVFIPCFIFLDNTFEIC